MGMISLMTSKDMILTLVFYLGLTLSQASGSCLHPNMTWVSEDILDSVHPVETPYLCQAICVDTEGCAAFTWTTADNQRLKLHCFLFGSKDDQTSCQECVSGPESCTCSTEVACEADEDNIVDEIVGVHTEADCQNYCLESSPCLFYTWQSNISLPAYSCILLSSCEDTVPCRGCYSGPQGCSQPSLPDERYSHSMNTLMICGGFYTRTTC